jgi:hypothetical protein
VTEPRHLVWHLVVGPLAGAAIGTVAYVQLLRPLLSGPAWLLDTGASLSGALGLLAGGVLSFRVWPPRPEGRTGDVLRPGSWSPVRAFSFSAFALLGALVLAGVPLTPWSAIGACVVGGIVAGVRRRT